MADDLHGTQYPEPFVGQWRINNDIWRAAYSKHPYKLIQKVGLNWLCEYEYNCGKMTLTTHHLDYRTRVLAECGCGQHPVADGDYMCYNCRLVLETGTE